MLRPDLWGEKRKRRELIRTLQLYGLPIPDELRPGYKPSKLTFDEMVARNPVPPWLWWHGKLYYRLHLIARRNGIPYGRTCRWAMRNPHLLRKYRNKWYCLEEELPHPRKRLPSIPSSIEHEGKTYYCIAELAWRRQVTPRGARTWARSRPHLTVLHNGHLYCRDEEWHGRHRLIPFVDVEGKRYWSLPALAARLGLEHWAVNGWAKRHPEETTMVNGHIYVHREIQARGLRTKDWIGRDGHIFYSVRCLARRRGVTDQAAAKWVKRHPDLMIREAGCIYARDEPYPKTGPRIPPKTGPPEIVLKTIAARRARSRR